MNIRLRINQKIKSLLGVNSDKGGRSLSQKFSKIYRKNLFEGTVSRSGGGSDLVQTEEIRKWLPGLLESLNVNSFLDAPCGDFFWMREIDFGRVKYIGVDIVEELIDQNNKAYRNDKRDFVCRNLAEDPLPPSDLIFCRDCLVHLSYDDINKVLRNFKASGAKYLVTTTFTERPQNKDLLGNDVWRTLNLTITPFDFPPPIQILNEKCTEGDGAFGDKCLGVWELQSIELQ